MAKNTYSFPRRMLALLLSALLLMPSLALAFGTEQTLLIGVQWTDGEGNPQFAAASPLPYPGYEACYWVQVPSDAFYQLTLSVQDLSGVCASFYPDNGMPLSGLIADAGDDLQSTVPLEITGYTGDGQPALLLHLYVSTVTVMPEQPREAIPDAEITLRYMSRDGLEIASAARKTLPAGNHEVFPEAYDLLPNYVLGGEASQWVTVDEDGANPAEVIFYYDYVKPPVQPADVPVRYLDAETYAPVASDTYQRVEEGTASVFAAPNDLLPGYELVGYPSVEVRVDENGANPAEVIFYYQYVKLAVQPVDVPVHYVDEMTGEPVAADSYQTVPEGTAMVYAAPEGLAEYYVLTGDAACPVTVDENGANPAEVTFRYRYEAPQPTEEPTPTEAPVTAEPREVTVCYVDQLGTPIAAEETLLFQPGDTLLSAPEAIGEDYLLVSADSVVIHVDEYGAYPERVEFVYAQSLPVPKIALVPVKYFDVLNNYVFYKEDAICQDDQENLITVNWDIVAEEGYTGYITETEAVPVTVNGDGAAYPAEVVFSFILPAEPTEAPEETPEETPEVTPVPETPVPVIEMPVTVRFETRDGMAVATPQEFLCYTGMNNVEARPFDLAEGYELVGEGTCQVVLDVTGQLTPGEVVFLYAQEDTPLPAVGVIDRWGETTAKVNFRTDMSTNAGKVKGKETIGNKARVYVYSSDVVDGQQWYAVQVDGKEGYVAAEFVNVYSQEDSDIIQRGLPSPVPSRSPATEVPPTEVPPTEVPPTEIPPTEVPPTEVPPTEVPVPLPQVGVIERWGVTTSKVNFRTDMSMNAGKVNGKETIGNKTRVYVHASDVVDGQQWYAVQTDGKEGYVAAEFVNVYSQQESDEIQRSLPSPVPTWSPATEVPPTEVPPTEVPPTEVPPTEVPPTEVPPTETPAPLPEVGVIDRWAVTTSKVNFRVDMSMNAGKVKGKETIGNKTRVYVQTSDIVDGQQWYAVQVDGKEGFVAAEFINVYSQEESDAIQRSLPSPVPTQAPERTPAPTPTEVPPTETPAPTPAPTETPAPYTGYAVTQWQAALRPGVSDKDVLEWLANDTLVYISGQTVVNEKVYSSVQVPASGNYGFVEDRALLHITNEDAKPYLDKLQPTEATATPIPDRWQGYAMTKGDGVPLRQFSDTNAAISQLLPYGTVVEVMDQVYPGGVTWYLVRVNGEWGYVRDDQMRVMDEEEVQEYLRSQEYTFATPTPAPTPDPVSPDSPSSYGHVRSNSGKVHLRAQPSKNSQSLRLLNNYAFALVLGTLQNNEGVWYHVSQSGTEGYIHGDYFKALSLSELTDFLKSPEYEEGNTEISHSSSSSAQIQPLEEYNKTVWQNPKLSPSYEPFNPNTPTPNPEALPTPTLVPTSVPTPEATPEIGGIGAQATPEPDAKGGSSPWPWVLLGLAAVGGGGAYYAYSIYRKNERRRQAARAQQRARQAQSATAQPQMRAARNNPAQQAAKPYHPSAAAPFMPPQNTAPTANPYQPQVTSTGETQKYRPADPAAASSGAQEGTQKYAPVTRNGDISAQTSVYQPVDSGASPETAEGARPRKRRADRYKNNGDNA